MDCGAVGVQIRLCGQNQVENYDDEVTEMFVFKTTYMTYWTITV